jgi:hypothetical protein
MSRPKHKKKTGGQNAEAFENRIDFPEKSKSIGLESSILSAIECR